MGLVPLGELPGEREQARGGGGIQLDPEDAASRIRRSESVSGRSFAHRCAIHHTLQPMRLLLVEDDPMIGEAIRAGLKREGFTVDWVHEARAAEAVLRTEPFELLLLDLGLPGRDGLHVPQGPSASAGCNCRCSSSPPAMR